MASTFKFITYNAPSQRKQQKKKAFIPTLTSTVKRGQQTTSPMESLLTPGAGESPFDMVASQPPEPEVHFSQFKFGGSGPAPPDDIPSIAELLEGLKATRTSSLDGEHVITTEDNPDSSLGMHSVSQSGLCSDNPDGSGKSESDIPPILIEDSDRSDDDGDSDEMPMVSSGQSHSTGGLYDMMLATALSEPSQPSEAHFTAPGTTASSPSITTAKTSPPQSHLDDSGCPTESAENAGLVEDDESHDDDEDLSNEDSDFAVRHYRGIARRGARHHVQRTKRRRESSHDAIRSGIRETHEEDGEPPRNAKRHKPSATDTRVTSADGECLRSKHDIHDVAVGDGLSSCDRMSDGDSSSGSTERDSSSDNTNTKSPSSVSGDVTRRSKGKGRLWTGLENERLRAYRTEKSWDWIANTLMRTKAAVQVHWSLIKKSDH